MIIPSIDLQRGNAVQLIGGEALSIDAGDPFPIARRFSVAGEIAVIDLDAAMGTGQNRAVIEQLVATQRCRVGGGIRDQGTAEYWLDRGAEKIIVGTAATAEFLKRLPKHRLIAALDARDGEVVVEGWKTRTGLDVIERIKALRDYVGGFLVTFVEREGRMGGTDLAKAAAIIEAAGPARVTIAGGVTTADEIATLDAMGADAQVGMALYSGKMDLGDAIIAPAKSDRPDGLYPTVVCDEHGGALGLVYSNEESVREAVRLKKGVYWSRSRGGLWQKGESSGASQELIRIDLDCDRDALRFIVRQHGVGFCHQDTWTCWGQDTGLPALARRLMDRVGFAPPGSYTRRLLDDPKLLRAKLIEEARELAQARGTDEVLWEAADVFYFTMVSLARSGVPLSDVGLELDRRARKIVRRKGDAKPQPPDAFFDDGEGPAPAKTPEKS